MWDEFAEKAKQEEAKLQKQQEEEARVRRSTDGFLGLPVTIVWQG